MALLTRQTQILFHQSETFNRSDLTKYHFIVVKNAFLEGLTLYRASNFIAGENSRTIAVLVVGKVTFSMKKIIKDLSEDKIKIYLDNCDKTMEKIFANNKNIIYL